jgi:hypothetical protein
MAQVLEYGRVERSRANTVLNEVGAALALGVLAVGLGIIGTLMVGMLSDVLGLQPWMSFTPACVLAGIVLAALVAYTIRRDRRLARVIAYWLIYLSALALFAWIYSLLPPWV